MDYSPLLCAPDAKAQLENNNAVDQIDMISGVVIGYGAAKLRESHVLELHKLAVNAIYPCGGQYRSARNHVTITCSDHEVPDSALVPSYVRDALLWVNDSHTRSPLEKAAYVLWRFNWIHPFCGGNGRTSRALAYLILCMAEGTMLPGSPVMPDLIYTKREEYIRVLRQVDASARVAPDAPDFAPMVDFLRDVITEQLASALNRLSICPSAAASSSCRE